MRQSLPTCLAFALLLLVAAPTHAAEPPANWTLDDAFRRTIASHPNVLQAIAKSQSARAQVAVARNAWLPTATLDVNHQEATNNAPSAPTASYGLNPYWQGSLQSKWIAWDFGKTTANMDAAEANVVVAEQDLRAAKVQLWSALAQGWVAVMAADAGLSVYQASLVQLQRQRDAVRQQVELRARPELDLWKAETDVAGAEGDVLRAEEVARSQRLALAVAIAEPHLPPGPLAPPAFDLQTVDAAALDDDARLDQLVALAVTNRPEFASIRARIEALQRLQLAAERVIRPNVYVSGQANAGGNDLSALAFNYGLTVGLAFPLSTLWTQQPYITDAAAQIRALAASQDAQILTLRGQINLAISSVVQARKRMPVAAAQVRFGEKALDAATQRYKAGAGLWLDVADAESTLLKARLAVVQAELDVQAAVAQLAYSLGRITPLQ